MTFKDLISDPKLQQAIEESGYNEPTPIQQEAIPLILSGVDLRASAQTGTGKTAAFLLPALSRLSTPSSVPGQGPRILILVPTRELAMQVASQSVKYSKYLPRTKTVCIYGGAPYPIQNKELSRPYDVLVATPGRLIDHLERGRINFSRIEMLILDEADRMLDMGFIDPVEQIAAATPKTRQTLMFSATLKGSVLNLSKRLLNQPQEVSVAAEHAKHENIEQHVYIVDNLDHKCRLLDHLLKDSTLNQAVVFTSTKRQADQLVDKLLDLGHEAAALHGDMNQRQRTRTIMQMRRHEVRILIATDVAARGIDVQTITHVINFDLPMGLEDYVHRIGRTGRAGAKGIAISFVAGKDMSVLRRIEQFTGHKMIPQVVAGLEPTFKAKPTSHVPGNRSRFGGGGYKQNRNERPRGEYSPRGNYSASRGDRSRSDSPRSEGPRTDRFRSETPRGEGAARSDRFRSETPRGEGTARSDRFRSEHSRGEGARTGRFHHRSAKPTRD